MYNKKVVVIGAGGIVGQHMMVNKPEWADATFTRRECYLEWSQLNVGEDDIEAWLDANSPDVIINLAGQNVVDAKWSVQDPILSVRDITNPILGEIDITKMPVWPLRT